MWIWIFLATRGRYCIRASFCANRIIPWSGMDGLSYSFSYLTTIVGILFTPSTISYLIILLVVMTKPRDTKDGVTKYQIYKRVCPIFDHRNRFLTFLSPSHSTSSQSSISATNLSNEVQAFCAISVTSAIKLDLPLPPSRMLDPFSLVQSITTGDLEDLIFSTLRRLRYGRSGR